MSEFRVDVIDSAGVRVGDGPLTNITRLETVNSLDKIGSTTFTMPATDPRTAYIVAGRGFDIYDRLDGYVGRFWYKSKQLQSDMLVISAHDQLQELVYPTVGFRRVYSAIAVETVIASLIALASGWSATVDAGIGTTSITYEGNSVLNAIDALRDRWGQHYRLASASVLAFGAFGSDSGVRLTNLSGQVQPDIAGRTELAIVQSIQLTEESDEIFNQIIPVGAGQGVSQLTIYGATSGSYTVQTGTNQDGSSYYYIEDSASVSAYGRRTRVLSLPQFRPITNSVANTTAAANALKLTAETYIGQHLAPRVCYAVTVAGLRQAVEVGDTVRLLYRGIVDNYAYIDVDEDFYVMDITKRRDNGGARVTILNIASTAARLTSDQDIILDVINDVRALKINIPITLAYSPVGPYTQRIDSTHTASFTVRIGSEVTALNYAKMRFKTMPLTSSITTLSTVAQVVTTTTAESHTHAATSSETHTHAATSSETHTHAATSSETHTHAATSSETHTHAATSSETHSHADTVAAAHSHTATTSTTHDHTIGDSGSHSHSVTIGASGGHQHDITDVTASASGPGLHSHGVVATAVSATHSHPSTTIPATTHTHSITADGAHTHSVASSGSHSHSITAGGAHTHSITASGAHTHSIAASGAHTHSIAASGAHTHSITASGDHSHAISSSGSHSHSITIPAHSHAITYGLYTDTVYPQTISVTVNGTSVSGGPWAPTNAAVEVEVDITSLITAGTLRQNHAIVFSCTTGKGEIEFECDMLVSIQAIQVT